MSKQIPFAALATLGFLISAPVATAQFKTKYTKPQMKGLAGSVTKPIFTVGETLPSSDKRFPKGYQPVGILDGLGITRSSRSKHRHGHDDDKGHGRKHKDYVTVLANHELTEAVGYAYKLANKVELLGARISYFQFDAQKRTLLKSGLAYDTIYDRAHRIVKKAVQVNESNEKDDPRTNLDPRAGMSRFCSSQMVHRGTYGFVDEVYLTGEETGDPRFHPNGGSIWALDVKKSKLWAVPAVGRGSWENVTPVNVGPGYTGLLLADDSSPQDRNKPSSSAGSTTKPADTIASPLYLWIGKKNASKKAIRAALPKGTRIPRDNFLNRNGLLVGKLYYLVMQDPKQRDPRHFAGGGNVTVATWKEIHVLHECNAGKPGYDLRGYKDGYTMRLESKLGGAYQFSRPEDLTTAPILFGRLAVLAATGRGRVFGGADKWGVLYQFFLLNLTNPTAPFSTIVRIQYDGNDKGNGDFGLRSPDNLVFADSGMVLAQEDRAISSSDTAFKPGLFGQTSKQEASIFSLDPWIPTAQRIAQVDRSVVVPMGTTDSGKGDIGNWETSGIIDVTRYFKTKKGEQLFLFTVQAHGIRDGLILKNNLVQGGQLVFLSLGGK